MLFLGQLKKSVMRNILTIILWTSLILDAWCQSDILPTDNGKVTMTPILHATAVLEMGWKDDLYGSVWWCGEIYGFCQC